LYNNFKKYKKNGTKFKIFALKYPQIDEHMLDGQELVEMKSNQFLNENK
jgi:hypothetical protein